MEAAGMCFAESQDRFVIGTSSKSSLLLPSILLKCQLVGGGLFGHDQSRKLIRETGKNTFTANNT